jgi:hypothetical protein
VIVGAVATVVTIIAVSVAADVAPAIVAVQSMVAVTVISITTAAVLILTITPMSGIGAMIRLPTGASMLRVAPRRYYSTLHTSPKPMQSFSPAS